MMKRSPIKISVKFGVRDWCSKATLSYMHMQTFTQSYFVLFRPVVDGFLIVYQAGICCVYVLFVATNIKKLMDIFDNSIDVKVYVASLLLPFILLMCVRNLKLLAPFSLFSNFLTFAGKLQLTERLRMIVNNHNY